MATTRRDMVSLGNTWNGIAVSDSSGASGNDSANSGGDVGYGYTVTDELTATLDALARGATIGNVQTPRTARPSKPPFKIGDRVVCISPPDRSKEFVGKRGRVIDVRWDASLPVRVDFGRGLNWSCETETLRLDKDWVDPRVGLIKK